MTGLFEIINRKLQFKFKDRVTAANILGESLKDEIKNKQEQKAAVVLGIARAGIITADIIAKKLSTHYVDILIPRKLTDPDNKEQAIGAVMEDGTTYINRQLLVDLHITQEYLEKERAEQMNEINRRMTLYCKHSTKKDFSSFIKAKTVILVDDGAATGATVIATARWINLLENQPKRFIVAIPVAPKGTVDLVKRECNAEVYVVIAPPSSTFHSVEQYHQKFEAITDEQVIKTMTERNLLRTDADP